MEGKRRQKRYRRLDRAERAAAEMSGRARRLEPQILHGRRRKLKLFAESWQRMRVFRMMESDFGCRMLPERRCASFIT